MSQASLHLGLRDETLFYSIRYFDQFLYQNKDLDKTKYHLYASTCLKISDSINEISTDYFTQKLTQKYAKLSQPDFEEQEILNAEIEILNFLNFD